MGKLNMVYEKNNQAILCSVSWMKQNEEGKWFGGLEALCESDGQKWMPIANAKLRFPDAGEIFWWDAPQDIPEGTLRLVEVRPALGYNPPKKKDKFEVSAYLSEKHLVEAIEVPGIHSNEELRKAISTGQLRIEHAPISSIIISVPESDAHWLGPVKIAPINDITPNLFSIASSSGFLSQIKVATESLQDLSIKGNSHRILRPGKRIPASRSFFNVQADKELLLSLLRRIRSMDRKAAQALSVSKTVLEKYIEILTNSELVGKDRQREKARLDAAFNLIKSIDQEESLIEEVVESLMAIESVNLRVEKGIQDRINDEVDRIKASTVAATQEVVSSLERLRGEQKQERQILKKIKKDAMFAVADIVEDAVGQVVKQTTVKRIILNITNTTQQALPPKSIESCPSDRKSILKTLYSLSEVDPNPWTGWQLN